MATESKIADSGMQDSKASMQGGLNEPEVTNSLKALSEEFQQISELVEMEKSYLADVTTQLKQMITPLNASYHIKPESVSKNDSSISDVVLTPQGIVCVFYNSGTVVTRPLESIASEVLIRILGEVIPDVKALMNERRQKLSGRVMTLEKLSKEIRKVPTAGGRSGQIASGPSGQAASGQHGGRDRQPSADAMRSMFVEK